MQKLTIICVVAIMAVALTVPIFADEISNALTDTTNTNSGTNDSVSGNNSSNAENSTLNATNNSTLTPQQLQTLTDTQGKLTALIATIESLKVTYGNNTKAKGLLNALDQFEKQATRLNSEISAFIQNPTVNSTDGVDGIINSFVKREAALEHKVAIKQELLVKMSDKTVSQGNKKLQKNQKKQKRNREQNK